MCDCVIHSMSLFFSFFSCSLLYLFGSYLDSDTHLISFTKCEIAWLGGDGMVFLFLDAEPTRPKSVLYLVLCFFGCIVHQIISNEYLCRGCVTMWHFTANNNSINCITYVISYHLMLIRTSKMYTVRLLLMGYLLQFLFYFN